MRVLTVRIMSIADAFQATMKDATRAMSGVAVGSDLIFPSVEQLAKTMLAPNRWQIIKAMEGAPAISIRELSRIVNRDFRGVYNDVQALLAGGVLNKEGEKIVLPYDRIRIEFNSDDAAA
ncbi:transcriptional regulator [Salmonella enterica subsp. enterica serovar Hull]|uniref:Transcriptional regulator n=1 Tax=Salmonella enterica subsp. enterica serovar Hull TaxID=1403564 RepID=A0A5X4PE08_SALET|nr:transcriptional regulator [Citrobacter sedlakii]EAS2833378.1 transcriptional regulator [Salmonella enterica]EBZ7585870.1 transcriptional regulator [Salmonella enterica subsp. enterica serovar Hull]ECC3814901.1 transcriptional regulator [Salmonella enterica subsp. enterica]ECC8734499.1 transcriptional regulator [Salmonella bongori]ECF2938625.1 transcriptional regulator [Salmonella enterica subsp. enterica serovar Reading]ECN6005605.1 transcriptional regulator [Salmonella enterica subsp. ent